MSFLAIVLILWFEKFSALRPRIQHDAWFSRVISALQQGSWAALPSLALALLVLLPLLLLALVLHLADSVFYGLLVLPIDVLVLLYSLGRGDLLSLLGPFRDAWRRSDAQGALHVAERDLALEAREGVALLEQVQGYVLWQAFQSFFVVIFWYLLLGPLLALAYRLLALAAEQSQFAGIASRAQVLRHALEWLPVRVLSFTFALVGDFVAVSRALLHEMLSWDITASQVVAKAGRAAADLPEPIYGPAGVETLDQLWQLLLRAAVVWYVAAALWVLFG